MVTFDHYKEEIKHSFLFNWSDFKISNEQCHNVEKHKINAMQFEVNIYTIYSIVK